ncbi:unnamed protein product [Rotaria sp. Silwood2]|nr:unnamed protein product [Rotaria sp. Silwood2]CAF2520658.1 unnamed protein product [Rotaria sp. Silwood2]CAF2777320.1 unnamed protein product [Rotaria sp. Silwood2]CAF4242798.1 unnamed protein product [Rotaria sp. Silwood2]CAF4256564.1 unnamed protein product [Rotaria sp. Silwood2]
MASGFEDEKLNACCLTEYRPLPGSPRGQIIKIAEISTYHVPGTDHTAKNKTIVLLTDIFGLTKNPRITADELSEKTGFDVYIPDLFNGDAIASSFLQGIPQVPGEKMSIGSKITFAGKFITSLVPWLFRHRQAVTLPIVEKFFKALRSEKGVTRVQAVGYCFGGLYALLVGSKELHLADAIVGCHVSLTNKTHYEQLNVPAAFVCAQEDDQFTDALRAEAEQILARKSEIPSKFLLTEGTVHGFASRPNPDNTIIMNAYKKGNDFIAEWAKAHL